MRAAALILVALLACSAQAKMCDRLPAGHARDACERVRDAVQADPKRKLLTYDFGSKLETVQEFFYNVLGGNWAQYLPSAFANVDFDWSKLGTFDYTSNMHYFVDAVYAKNITAPKTLKDVSDNMEQVSSIFCTPEKYVPSQKVYATCVGPKVALNYVPKVCILDEATQQVVCDPAKIVLSMAPGGCTHKYQSPSSWKGKECKIAGTVGFTQEKNYGGSDYILPLTSLSVSYDP
ncbi:hypothetical protein N2152v2_005332 [Parachlorella kessleri]